MASDFELTVLKELGEIKADLATNTQATLDLSGPLGRVTKLEKDSEKHETRQWIHSLLVVTVMPTIHAVLKHFRVDV